MQYSAYYIRKLYRRNSALLAAIFLTGFLTVSVLAPWLPISAPNSMDLSVSLRPPVWVEGGESGYPMGTDQQGRSILSRLIFGGRISLVISLAALGLAISVGVPLGLISGYSRRFDNLIMRVADIQLSFPSIMLAVAIVASLGPSIFNLIVVLALTGWVEQARVIRSQVMSLKEQEFVEAAQAAGCSSGRILFRHILPNVLSSIVVIGTVQIARFMLQEAGLSFLGLGIPPSLPSWGGMLRDAQKYIFSTWWPAFFPGIAITTAVLSVNVFGDWLNELLNPKLKRQGKV